MADWPTEEEGEARGGAPPLPTAGEGGASSPVTLKSKPTRRLARGADAEAETGRAVCVMPGCRRLADDTPSSGPAKGCGGVTCTWRAGADCGRGLPVGDELAGWASGTTSGESIVSGGGGGGASGGEAASLPDHARAGLEGGVAGDGGGRVVRARPLTRSGDVVLLLLLPTRRISFCKSNSAACKRCCALRCTAASRRCRSSTSATVITFFLGRLGSCRAPVRTPSLCHSALSGPLRKGGPLGFGCGHGTSGMGILLDILSCNLGASRRGGRRRDASCTQPCCLFRLDGDEKEKLSSSELLFIVVPGCGPFQESGRDLL